MRALLDVNVLIALLDADHTQHATATRWLADHLPTGWATCPITQNGCIRIMSQPAYPNTTSPGTIAHLLGEAAQSPAHEFWPDELNTVHPGTLDWRFVLGSRQLTDVYLLALAVKRNGCLVTFDRAVGLGAVPGAASGSLVVL